VETAIGEQYLYYYQTPPLQDLKEQVNQKVVRYTSIAAVTDNADTVVGNGNLDTSPTSTPVRQTSRALQYVICYMVVGMIYNIFHNNNNNNNIEEVTATTFIYDMRLSFGDHQHEIVVVAATAFKEQTFKWYDSIATWLYYSNIAIR